MHGFHMMYKGNLHRMLNAYNIREKKRIVIVEQKCNWRLIDAHAFRYLLRQLGLGAFVALVDHPDLSPC